MERNPQGDGNNKELKKKKQNNSKIVWRAFLLTVIGAAILSLAINLLYEKTVSKTVPQIKKQPLPSATVKRTEETLKAFLNSLEENKEYYLLKALKVSLPQIEKLNEEYRKKITRRVETAINTYFAEEVYPSEPRFVDWIYSLTTQYLLLFYKGKDLITDDTRAQKYFEEHFESILIKPKKLETYVKTRITPEVQKLCREYTLAVKNTIKENLKKIIEKELTQKVAANNLSAEELNSLSSEITDEIFQSLAPSGLRQAGAGGLGTLVGVVVYKIIIKKVLSEESARLAASLAEKLAAKVALKEGAGELIKVLGGALSGAALCSWGGPVGAAVCGVAAGITAWVASDYALNKIDYYLNRKEVQKEIHRELLKLKNTLAENLVKSYTRCFDRIYLTVKGAAEKGVTIKELSNP